MENKDKEQYRMTDPRTIIIAYLLNYLTKNPNKGLKTIIKTTKTVVHTSNSIQKQSIRIIQFL